jgi:hypothetical protein
LRRLDCPVLILAHGLVEQVGEGARLDDIPLRPRLDFTLEQLLQHLDGKVSLRHPLHFGKELVGKNGNVGSLETSGGENVHDLVGHHSLGNDLPDRVVEFLVGLALARRAFGQHRPNRLK